MRPNVIHRQLGVVSSLLSLLQGHRWLLPVVVVLGLLSSVLEGASLSLLIPLLQTLTKNANLGIGKSSLAMALQAVIGVVPHDLRLAFILGAMFVGICLKNLVSYANVASIEFVDSRVSHNLRALLFERILAMPLATVEGFPTGLGALCPTTHCHHRRPSALDHRSSRPHSGPRLGSGLSSRGTSQALARNGSFTRMYWLQIFTQAAECSRHPIYRLAGATIRRRRITIPQSSSHLHTADGKADDPAE
jgi:ABC-type multidrug transport system fused ATPase/permease subunit